MMKTNNVALIFKKAPFPAITTIIFFVLFIGAYWAVTATTIEPYYLEGLIFAVPFVCFGIVSYVTVTEKLKTAASSVITVILIFALGFAMLGAFAFIVIDMATTVTTDIGKYERILKLKDYPNDHLTRCFPEKIPENAQNIEFSYNPAFAQGSENLALKFKTDSDSIKGYMDEFSQRAGWIGKPSGSEAENHGIFTGTLYILSYANTGLPNDFTIYLIDGRPYHPGDWNHGERSLVAISESRNEILFLAEDW